MIEIIYKDNFLYKRMRSQKGNLNILLSHFCTVNKLVVACSVTLHIHVENMSESY